MADAIDRLKGEWAAQTGSTLQVDRAARLDPAATAPPDADALVVASDQLAELAARSWVVAMSPEVIRQRDEVAAGAAGTSSSQGSWSEVFPLLRAREAVWGSDTVAVPFGSPVLTLYYRADLLEKLGARPPRTWSEYEKLARLFEDRTKLGELAPPSGTPWCGAMEPLGPGWAGTMLLARAAPYVTHRANYSALFQIDTMEPLIDGPPFVRALEEQAAALGAHAGEQIRSDPDAVRRAFWAGQCGMAVTWPSATDKGTASSGRPIRLGLVELPGSKDVYNIAPQAWETRRAGEDPHVPLLGVAGRLGMVTPRCPAPDAAFRLLLWLSAPQRNRQVSAASPATTLFRQSDMRMPQAWTEPEIPPATAAQYAMLTQQALGRQQWLFDLRIPGRAEYVAVLDEAVQQVIRGKQKPQEALRQVKARWIEITSRLGLDRQRDAYRRSLGL